MLVPEGVSVTSRQNRTLVWSHPQLGIGSGYGWMSSVIEARLVRSPSFSQPAVGGIGGGGEGGGGEGGGGAGGGEGGGKGGGGQTIGSEVLHWPPWS